MLMTDAFGLRSQSVSGRHMRVKVLSLSLWAHLASTHKDQQFRQGTTVDPAAPSNPTSRKSIVGDVMQNLITFATRTLKTAPNRCVGQALTSVFHYSSDYPVTSYGVFLFEQDVDEVLGNSSNYKYYDELCCMYHMKVILNPYCLAVISYTIVQVSILYLCPIL